MAEYVVWKPYYSVDNASLDMEHKIIVGLINELYAAVISKKEEGDLKAISDRLVRYTNKHFQHEEQVMRECDYPRFYDHKLEHEHLRQRTLDFHNNLDLVTGRDMLRFLKEWWREHIQKSDKAYASYLQMAMR